uniref:Uncharacterized protein n=1 Tax=Meloidogyne enterolobii TaxID=390850 RepID=A0A6V7VPQ1_MELEN|nr:unnamed protein product [Meloidogyne enterolobii]
MQSAICNPQLRTPLIRTLQPYTLLMYKPQFSERLMRRGGQSEGSCNFDVLVGYIFLTMYYIFLTNLGKFIVPFIYNIQYLFRGNHSPLLKFPVPLPVPFPPIFSVQVFICWLFF